MAAQRQAKPSPEMTRTVMRMIAIEAVVVVAAVAVYLTTQNTVWLLAIVAAGAIAVAAVFLPAYLRHNEDVARRRGDAPIVDDPHGRL
jgi:hypothetical protein